MFESNKAFSQCRSLYSEGLFIAFYAFGVSLKKFKIALGSKPFGGFWVPNYENPEVVFLKFLMADDLFKFGQNSPLGSFFLSLITNPVLV